MKSSPLARVKERFGDKVKLVAAVKKLATDDLFLDRLSVTKGLDHVSNAKLIRLHDQLERAKKDFGSRAKLIESIATAEKRTKDEGFKARLQSYPLPRLLDIHRAATRRGRRTPVSSTPSRKKSSGRKAS